MDFSDVRYRYKGEDDDALRGFSLSAGRGRVMALVGPNGSGKSTALGVASGWLKPTGGRFARDGQAAFLPQSERLAFAFSALEYVTFGRAPHLPYLAVPSGRDEALALAALASVGMERSASRRVNALSGGELQLVRIARAMVQEADYVILDEPTDMLDPAHASALCSIVRGMAESGKGILLSTHDIAFALACADDAALIRDGRVMAVGPAPEALSCDALGGLFGLRFERRSLPVPDFMAHGRT